MKHTSWLNSLWLSSSDLSNRFQLSPLPHQQPGPGRGRWWKKQKQNKGRISPLRPERLKQCVYHDAVLPFDVMRLQELRVTESSRQCREQRLMAYNDTTGTEHTRNKRKPGEGPRFSLELIQSCRFTCGRSLCLSCFPFICVHTCVKTNQCSLCSQSILQSSDSGTEYKLGGGSEEGKSLKYAEPFFFLG